MSRIVIPNDVQSLIDEISPFIANDIKEIDVIRTVLFDFKLRHVLNKQDQNGFNSKTVSILKDAIASLDRGEGITFESSSDVEAYVQDNTQ